jgi:chemotaxis protein MotB
MTTHNEQYDSEGEESYFISMTDIMVGMLFVFIILLMYFVFRIQTTSEPMIPLSVHQAALSNLETAKSRIKELEEEIKRLNLNPLERYLKLADAAREGILRDLKSSLKDVPGIGEGDVRVIAEQGILRLSGDMLFPNGVSTIGPGSPSDFAVRALSTALTKVLPYFSLGPASNPIKSCNPNAIFIDAVFIEGHTDNGPIRGLLEGSIKDNLSLSARRAINTVQSVYSDQPRLAQMFSISPSQHEIVFELARLDERNDLRMFADQNSSEIGIGAGSNGIARVLCLHNKFPGERRHRARELGRRP